ncbi:MAG TPA: hypothetical protein VIN04_01390 [Myxococcota bacterium]
MKPPHDAANGSVPRAAAKAARGALVLLVAAQLAACATAPTPSPARRAAAEAAARAAADRAAREASGFVGVYAARLATRARPGLAVTLELRVDGTAELAIVSVGRGIETWPGRWGRSGEELRVEWDPVAPATEAPPPMRWRREGERLVPVQWDPNHWSAWGAAGPVLARWVPSRVPRPGCRWRPFADAALALRLLVEACDGDPPARFVARGTAVIDTADPSAGESGTPILEVFAKKPGEPLADAIRKRFFPQLVPRVRKGCAVRRAVGVHPNDRTKETWTIAPTETYRAQTAKWRAAEPAAMVCGPYGVREGLVGYFEFHPKASPGRYLFVSLGPGHPHFDERSIELLD